MESETSIIFNSLVIVCFLLANGFFVASEFALVSSRKTKILQLKEEGNKEASIACEALNDLDRYIAATQLGITIASIGLGWVGEATIARIIEPVFMFLPGISKSLATHSISVAIAFSIITILHVVIGELMPKAIALQFPVKIALFVAKPMKLIAKIFNPMIFILNGLGFSLLKVLHIPHSNTSQFVHSTEELNMIIDASYQEGVLNETEKDLLQNVFKFSDLTAKQVMVPRTDMVCIPVDASDEEFKRISLENQYTRYPVYKDDLDHILGIVHIKDFYSFLANNQYVDISKIIRPAMLIPETVTIDNLVLEFRKNHAQIAIVVDEFGGTSGLVTLEDVIEEIVGEVQDEFDDEEETNIEKINDNEYIANAMMRIDELYEYFGLSLEEDVEDVETIGGLVVKELGRIAEIGDKAEYKDLCFEVLEIDCARILKLKIQKKQVSENEDTKTTDEQQINQQS